MRDALLEEAIGAVVATGACDVAGGGEGVDGRHLCRVAAKEPLHDISTSHDVQTGIHTPAQSSEQLVGKPPVAPFGQLFGSAQQVALMSGTIAATCAAQATSGDWPWPAVMPTFGPHCQSQYMYAVRAYGRAVVAVSLLAHIAKNRVSFIRVNHRLNCH